MKIEINKGNGFGNFEVIKELPKLRLPCGQTNRIFRCECVCGKTKDIRIAHLVRSKINSCGCLRVGFGNKTESYKYIRKIWRAIKYRTGENYHESHLYFDKGVIVCDSWLNDFNSFKDWAEENGLKKGLQIDRINSDGNYEPLNCRVVTPIVNCNNRENTYFVMYKGVKVPFMILLRDKNVLKNEGAIRGRIKRGWSIENAFDTPIRKGNYNRN